MLSCSLLLIVCVWTSAGLFSSIFDRSAIALGIVAQTQLSDGPVSVGVLVGENAHFYCSGNGFTIIWIVDEYSASESSIMARGITQSMVASSGTVQSTLTVPATLENNGTAVWCRVILLNGMSAISNNATLTVLPGELMLAAILHSEIHVLLQVLVKLSMWGSLHHSVLYCGILHQLLVYSVVSPI